MESPLWHFCWILKIATLFIKYTRFPIECAAFIVCIKKRSTEKLVYVFVSAEPSQKQYKISYSTSCVWYANKLNFSHSRSANLQSNPLNRSWILDISEIFQNATKVQATKVHVYIHMQVRLKTRGNTTFLFL